jgi:TRAP-type transport system periplasmic protein
MQNGVQVVKPSPQLKAGLDAIGKAMADEWLAKAGDAGSSVLATFKK